MLIPPIDGKSSIHFICFFFQTEEIESLRKLLDPEDNDVVIEKETFINAVLKFMEGVYNKNEWFVSEIFSVYRFFNDSSQVIT